MLLLVDTQFLGTVLWHRHNLFFYVHLLLMSCFRPPEWFCDKTCIYEVSRKFLYTCRKC